MHDHLRRRFWVETVMALVSGILCLLTILQNNWIEIVFNVDPDQYSGSLEWLIVVVSLAVTVTLVVLARYEWRRRLAVTI